jgi:sucrose-6F-phosphate phosphohydrolase
MKHKLERLLAMDIDGTLLVDGEPSLGLSTLRQVIRSWGGRIGVVYATGRSFHSTMTLVRMGVLPHPVAIASFVGTEVWTPPWSEEDRVYRREMLRGWDRDAVERELDRFEGLELQPQEFQSDLKISYYMTRAPTVTDIELFLHEHGLAARIIYSGSRFLDVIPSRAGKAPAIRYLSGVLDCEHSPILVAGDSMNDADMLSDPRFMRVIARNAESGLSSLPSSPLSHRPSLPFALGVLEGAEALGFLPARRDGSGRTTLTFECERGGECRVRASREDGWYVLEGSVSDQHTRSRLVGSVPEREGRMWIHDRLRVKPCACSRGS